MSRITLTCDQAIFTSIRTPMGEGYRIIAASKGLDPRDKQAITRNSPSHDALCQENDTTNDTATPPVAAAFYALPTGRLCVALSCGAGAEHTGRGGQRIYTHHVIVDAKDFPAFGYNPFCLWRAMITAGLTSPQLKPSAVLPALSLEISSSADVGQGGAWHPLLHSGLRRHLLQGMLEQKSRILSIDHGWLETAERLLLGVPGPLRSQISMGVGLRFSVGRCHTLNIVHDEQNATKTRSIGQAVDFIDAANAPEVHPPSAAWYGFVDRYWENGDYGGLAARTSLGFVDVSQAGREVIGMLYNQIDAMDTTETEALLTIAAQHLSHCGDSAEGHLAAKLVATAKTNLLEQFRIQSWPAMRAAWLVLVNLWKQSKEGQDFVRPMVEQALCAALRSDAYDAFEAALDIAPNATSVVVDDPSCQMMIDKILTGVVRGGPPTGEEDMIRLRRLCERWELIRPHCPLMEQIKARCVAAPVTDPAAN